MSDETQGIDPAPAAPNPAPASSPEGQPPATGGADSAPAASDPSAASQANGFQKRIDELTRARYDAERRAEHLERLLYQPPQKPDPAQPQAPKTLADFDYDEAKFQTYLFEQATQRATEAAEKRLKEQAERDRAQRRQGDHRSREAKFAETAKDYTETVYTPSLPITETMAEVAMDSEQGPELLYHLGKNPHKAAEIARLPPLAAARELGRLEAKLEFERDKAKAAAPVVSVAPPPPPKIDGSGDSSTRVSTTSPESDKLSDDEWVKAERARLARRAKRSA